LFDLEDHIIIILLFVLLVGGWSSLGNILKGLFNI